jgi:hypothetical protein
MDLALTLLLLWGLLFVPLGIVLHWFVLGAGSSVRALPVAPITGIAVGVLVLAALGRLGVDAGETWIPWVFVGVSVACAVVIWRAEVPWRSRELIGAGLLLLLAVTLVQLPVVGEEGDGPLGYGTIANPVEEVAAIDAAAGGPTSGTGVSQRAAETADERPNGFEQFAALTVAIGLDDDAQDARGATWTAYGLHAAMTGMLAALVALPLFAFARARGVKWFGLLVLVPLGVTAPAVFVALANGEGSAVASVAFTTTAVFSLLVTRRDRGWWALVVLYGAAVAATAGPMALLPLVAIGVAWMLLRSDTYEHLSQHDAPVAPARTLAVTLGAAALGVIATLPLLVGGGRLLAWSPLHTNLLDTVRSWPFQWLDSDLAVVGPTGPLETAIWLIGPALLAVAAIYAIVRNERRELGVLVGAVAAGAVAILVALLEERAGIRLFEFTVLSLSPFLAALAIRAVALARENAESEDQRPLAGTGPTLLVVAFVLLSFAATTVTGTRMAHAPSVTAVARAASIDGESTERDEPTAVIAAGDPWLAFVVDGERVRGGYADADAISDERNDYTSHGTRITGYDQVVLSSSPLSSDPSLRYLEQRGLEDYQVRLFRDRIGDPSVDVDSYVDPARDQQRARSQAADRPGGAAGVVDSESTAPDALEENAGTFEIATRHVPVEGNRNTPAGRPAGLLLPGGDVDGCSSTQSVRMRQTCEPGEPVVGASCTDEEVEAARSFDDRDREGGRVRPQTGRRQQLLALRQDDQLPARPPLLGVECFDVPLDSDAATMLVHLRDVGFVLPPEDAESTGSWELEQAESGDGGVLGGSVRSSSDLGSSLTWGTDRLGGDTTYDLVLEGEFGAGMEVSSGLGTIDGANGEPTVLPGAQLGAVQGSADGFSKILRDTPLSGSVTVTNDAGTDVSIGRMFARPRDLPRSCDVPIPLEPGTTREVRVDVPALDGTGATERPGLAVSVLDVDESGDEPVARVAVANYLSRFGLPRYQLVDWTEQYEGEVTVEGCDGALHTESGGDAGVARQAVASQERLAEALGAVQAGTRPADAETFQPED